MHITDIKETMAVLDVTTLVWSIPPLENPNVPKLVYHTATLVDKLMFITFGKLFLLSSFLLLFKQKNGSKTQDNFFFREYYGYGSVKL
jgi:hypothetical protein